MLKSNFFSRKNFNVFYSFRGRKFFGISRRAHQLAQRNFPLATRNFPLATSEISTSEEKQRPFWAQKEERAPCLRALSSSLYKFTTFSREKQIALTFRNNPRNVKMTRFAQASRSQVLYYDTRIDGLKSRAG